MIAKLTSVDLEPHYNTFSKLKTHPPAIELF